MTQTHNNEQIDNELDSIEQSLNRWEEEFRKIASLTIKYLNESSEETSDLDFASQRFVVNLIGDKGQPDNLQPPIRHIIHIVNLLYLRRSDRARESLMARLLDQQMDLERIENSLGAIDAQRGRGAAQ